MKTYIYDWEHFDDTGMIHMYIDREALQILIEYYNVKISALVQDKTVDEICENIREVKRMCNERQSIIDKLKENEEGQENEESLAE